MKPRISLESFLTSLYGALTLFAACGVTWVLLYTADFAYPTIHDVSGIAEGIDTYGPKNRFKVGFGDTTREQRIEIFEQINIAVHNGGQGLNAIMYESPSSGGVQKLLREPEVVHLQDVANLIDALRLFLLTALVAWIGTVVFFLSKNKALPSLKGQLVGLLGVVFVATVAVLIIGAERVFNTLHIWIFPDDHQWFFYYQESLMSTLMLAPRLFGWIAVLWVAIMVMCFFGVNLGTHYLQRRLNLPTE